MSRPVIGLAAAVEQAQWAVWDQPAALLPTNYLERIREAGGAPILLPPDDSAAEDPGSLLDLVDGLVLAGGADIDPAFYGRRPEPGLEATCPDRDRFELALAREAIGRGQPLLGICRGMQVINVALGGTLHQDIRDRVGDDRHRASIGDFAGADHTVELDAGSLASRSVGSTISVTKSHHHQSIDELGAGLVETARSPDDGTCEAIELSNGSFTLGVQWHAEATPGDLVIPAFVAAAAEWRGLRGRTA